MVPRQIPLRDAVEGNRTKLERRIAVARKEVDELDRPLRARGHH